MPYSQDIETCLAARLGAGGLDAASLDVGLGRLGGILADLREGAASGGDALLAQPSRQDDLAEISDTAERLGQADDVLVLGVGGSSLGGATLAAVAAGTGLARLYFLDNIDPSGFDARLNTLDPARTAVLIISKSGTTAETLTQALIILPWMARGGDVAARAAVISDPATGAATPLRRLAAHYGIGALDHVAAIGGRYAALTNVGLIPAAIAGVDPAKVRDGARQALSMTLDAASPADAPAAVGAALSVGLARGCGCAQTVMMPYLDRLDHFGAWYCQLWAESLGKGRHGTTPIDARGTVDQHSQLQLWLDGPRDKMFTLIFGAAAGTGGRIDTGPAGATGLEYLEGRTMGDLLAAEQEATRDALAGAGRATRVIRIKRADGASVGALMMHFMLETILSAHLLGVNPFDQPAVETGKRLARERLGAMSRK
jgi:glucose-6-phosphate isomerase